MIEEGMYVRYPPTGTVGKVVELTIINGKDFARIDTTELYYDATYLEKTTKPVERIKETTRDIDSLEHVKNDFIESLGNADMSENVGGG